MVSIYLFLCYMLIMYYWLALARRNICTLKWTLFFEWDVYSLGTILTDSNVLIVSFPYVRDPGEISPKHTLCEFNLHASTRLLSLAFVDIPNECSMNLTYIYVENRDILWFPRITITSTLIQMDTLTLKLACISAISSKTPKDPIISWSIFCNSLDQWRKPQEIL